MAKVGQFEDDAELTSFKTMLCTYKPSEVVYDRADNIDAKVMTLLKATAQLTPISGQ